jgi:hypothetical protein
MYNIKYRNRKITKRKETKINDKWGEFSRSLFGNDEGINDNK